MWSLWVAMAAVVLWWSQQTIVVAAIDIEGRSGGPVLSRATRRRDGGNYILRVQPGPAHIVVDGPTVLSSSGTLSHRSITLPFGTLSSHSPPRVR